jgi:peroxiredoxin
VAQLRKAKERFDKTGVKVVIVGLGTPEQSEEFRKKFQVPFTLISDHKKDLYRAFGLKQMSPIGFLSPSMIIKGFSTMSKGHAMGVPEGDVRQLPGVFVINTDGRIEFSHYAENPADHPDPETILELL